jgi:hypothetical protein
MPTNFFFTTPLLLLFMDPGSGMGKNHDPGSSTLLGGMQILGRPTPPPPPRMWIRIRIKGLSWIRIWIRIKTIRIHSPGMFIPDPTFFHPGSELFPSRIRNTAFFTLYFCHKHLFILFRFQWSHQNTDYYEY